jgi:hypothetical protein
MTRALASVALFLAILAPPPAFAKVAWRSCAEAGAPVSLSDVAFSPDPVLPGQRATFDVSANAATTLTSGRVTVAITIGTIVVATDALDLCDLTACPAPPGPLTVSYDRAIPGFVPDGTYAIRVAAAADDESAAELFCASATFPVAPIARSRASPMTDHRRPVNGGEGGVRNARGPRRDEAADAAKWDRDALAEGKRRATRARRELEEKRREAAKKQSMERRKKSGRLGFPKVSAAGDRSQL